MRFELEVEVFDINLIKVLGGFRRNYIWCKVGSFYVDFYCGCLDMIDVGRFE